MPGTRANELLVESLTIYPIKSCAGYKIPAGKAWQVRNEGLLWDREWCLIHQGTGVALSQKQYPKMTLIKPSIDLTQGVLQVRFADREDELHIRLSADPTQFGTMDSQHINVDSMVCDDAITAQSYVSEHIANFFSSALGVPCRLARFPSGGTTSRRHSKAHLANKEGRAVRHAEIGGSILLSNESPILAISRASLDRLNEQIKANGGRAVPASSFRANIVIANTWPRMRSIETPYVEDEWALLHIGMQAYRILGACRRCQMVCVDQDSGERKTEPLSTLAKTRRAAGRVWFGMHMSHIPQPAARVARTPTMCVGDAVSVVFRGDEADTTLRELMDR